MRSDERLKFPGPKVTSGRWRRFSGIIPETASGPQTQSLSAAWWTILKRDAEDVLNRPDSRRHIVRTVGAFSMRLPVAGSPKTGESFL